MRSSHSFAPLAFCIICVGISMVSSSAFAQKGAVQTKTETVKKNKSMNAGFNLGYTVSSDLAQQREPRLYTNRASAGLGIDLLDPSTGKERMSFGASIMGQYKSVGTEIEARNEVIELADLDLSVGTDFELGSLWNADHSLEIGAGNAFPTSEDSRYEGYKSVPYASVKLGSAFGPASFSQSLSISHVVNTYEYSPVTKEINADTSTTYALSLGAKFLKYFRAGIGGSTRITHYLDDSNTLSFNNTQSLSATFGRWSTTLKHTNGSHINDKTVDLWFVDEYRRLISLTLSCRF